MEEHEKTQKKPITKGASSKQELENPTEALPPPRWQNLLNDSLYCVLDRDATCPCLHFPLILHYFFVNNSSSLLRHSLLLRMFLNRGVLASL
jgi:hypothetical protein